MLWLNASLVVIGSLGIESSGYGQAIRRDPRLTKTTGILIRPSLMRTSEAIKQQANIPPHHAIYITDPNEIRTVTQSLTLRRGPYWTCGYDWDLEFVVSPKERIRASVKEDCRMLLYKGTPYVFEGAFARQLRSVFTRLKMRPTHYILDAQIPAQTEPEDALAELGRAGLIAYISGTLPNKPWMRVKFTVKTSVPYESRMRSSMKAAELKVEAQARKKLLQFIENAKAKARLEDVSEIRGAGSGTYDNTIENTQEVTIHFKTGTPKEEMTALAATENVEVVEAQVPDFYLIQILSAEVLSQESMAKLRQQAPLIQGLSRFPSVQRSLRERLR